MENDYTVQDLAKIFRSNARTAEAEAMERRHPGFSRLSVQGKLRVMVEDALLADVPPPPNTFAEVVRIQKERGQL